MLSWRLLAPTVANEPRSFALQAKSHKVLNQNADRQTHHFHLACFFSAGFDLLPPLIKAFCIHARAIN
jgi:hypothetical protein